MLIVVWISNETPKYYKELLKSYEERNNNKNKENTNSRDEIGERILMTVFFFLILVL